MARLRNSVNRVSTRELLEWEGGPTPAHPALDYYGASWLLVHYLAYRTPEQFADLQRRLVRGESPEAAWAAPSPPGMPAQPRALVGLDHALETYLDAEAQTRYRQVPETWTGEPEVRLIVPPEVHAIRLALWSQGPDKGVSALRAEVNEALSEDPDHPLALQLMASLTGEHHSRWRGARFAATAMTREPGPSWRAP